MPKSVSVLESRLAVFLALTVGYALLATSAYELFGALEIGVTFFPPAGLTFAAFLLLPYRMWPAIAAGIVVGEVGVNLSQGQGFWWSLGWAAANLIEPMVGATVAFHLARALAVTRRFGAAFLTGGLLLGPAVGASIGATVLSVSSQLEWSDSFPDILIGDALGVLVVAPIVMVFARPDLFVSVRRRDTDTLIVVLITLVATTGIVLAENLPIGYAAVPLLAIPAVRYGARELALAGLVVASVMTAATARGRGPWASLTAEGTHAELVQQQAFLLVALGAAWLLKLEVLARVAAVRDAETSRARLYAAEQLARDQRHLTAMYDALSKLSVAATTSEVLGIVEQHAGPAVDASGVLVVLDDDDGQLRVVGVWGTFERPFEMGEVLTADLDLPVVTAAMTNRPVIGGPDDRKVAMPLSVTSRRGALGLFRSPDHPWSENSQIRALAFASIVGDALARTDEYETERSVALTLQHAIMPGPFEGVDGLRIAGRYLPATETLEVGGDWYDVIVDQERRSATVLIGDVAGHSLHAAAVMGKLAAGARALAFAEQDPAQLIDRLDEIHCSGPDPVMTTLVCGRIDVDAHRLTYVTAGHPPPLLHSPDGSVMLLDQAHSPALAVGRPNRRHDELVALAPGFRLLFYTDGLVERRDADISDRIDTLAREFAAAPDDPDAACDAILAAMLTGDHEDDVALVILAVD